MRIIHLSDIHLSKDNITDFKAYYLDALKKDLIKLNEEQSIKLIIITGDLIDKGGASFDRPAEAYLLFEEEFINPISKIVPIPKDKFLFLPGNHDIERTEIDDIYEAGLTATISTIQAANKIILSSQNHFTDANKRIQKFKDFEKAYHLNTADYYYTNYQSYYIFEKEGFKVGFLLINDSWRCSSSLTKESHFIGVNQLFDAKVFFAEKQTDINIVLLHHPITAFNEEEQTETKNIIQNFDFELVLYGHTHSTKLSQDFGTNGNAIYLNVKSAFNNPREKVSEFQPGYNVLDIELPTLQIRCEFRRYIHDRFEFDKDTHASKGGIWNGKMVPRDDKREYHELYELTHKTVSSHLEDFNELLVIHKTNSVAPKSIEDLFVLPKITANPSEVAAESKDRRYDISEILSNDRHVLLFGGKESGKTTLLNRISIEVAKQFGKFKRIPIYVDFKTLAKTDVLSIVRKYLNERSNKIEQLAINGQLLLLIDNYDETELLETSVKRLESFLTKYRDNKCILTSTRDYNEMVEIDNSLFKRQNFFCLFLGPVGLKEFKELAFIWFQNNDDDWFHLNLDNLIKVFKILKIPRSFFSVSLFLWIIEKQQNFKPVNKNYLLNKFLQFILEGLIEEESKAGSFNFERKKEVLAEVALNMLNEGNQLENYALSKESIIGIINNYFKKNQRGEDPFNAFNYFFEKGIFKKYSGEEDEERISFRFESFFQFFLSLNIDYNPAFKTRVLSKDEILSFIEELDYYSGRNQSDKSLLSNSIDLLTESFEDLDSFIDDNTNKYLPQKFILLEKIADDIEPEIEKAHADKTHKEEMLEKQMKNLPVSNSIQVKQKLNHKLNFHGSLELTSRLLKNAENIQDPDLVNLTLDLVIRKLSKYGVFIQAIFSAFLEAAKESGKQIDASTIQAQTYMVFSPLFHQNLLYTWMGTDFLQVPLKRKIEGYINAKKSIEKQRYEQLLAVLIYVDLKLPGYMDLLRKSIKDLDNDYFLELYFYKMLAIYGNTSSKSSLAPQLKELMTMVLSKVKKLDKKTAQKNIDNAVSKIQNADSNDDDE